jgi:MFS family permease
MHVEENIQLGLKENWKQFTLLVIVNAFVGAMIGLERSILPKIAEADFGIAARSAILSFIVVFGLSKAFMNYFAGRFSDRFGRKAILIAGWLMATPVPFLLMWAKDWNWILVANLFLGVSQGLTWSITVIMKIDLAGPAKRGLAMGLNEFAGYAAVAASALATGYIASEYSLRPEPFYLGVVYVALGLLMSVFLVKETKHHVAKETSQTRPLAVPVSQKDVFLKTSFTDKNLSAVTQAGFVNNLNDGMAWGLFPIFFAAHQLDLQHIGWLAAIYPATSGILQLWTGHLSDSLGRKWMIAWGMWIQAIGIGITALGTQFIHFAFGSLLLGVGTAMVYPTLLAAIGDVAHPSWRASSVGIYRFWRDSGYAVGALIAGLVADAFGLTAAVWVVAALTMASGLVVSWRMKETLKRPSLEPERACIKVEELSTILAGKSSIILDVRSNSEFSAGSIPGSVNIPVDDLQDHMSEFVPDGIIITVCGKGGGRSLKAANFLRENGRSQAFYLCEGYHGWQVAQEKGLVS